MPDPQTIPIPQGATVGVPIPQGATIGEPPKKQTTPLTKEQSTEAAERGVGMGLGAGMGAGPMNFLSSLDPQAVGHFLRSLMATQGFDPSQGPPPKPGLDETLLGPGYKMAKGTVETGIDEVRTFMQPGALNKIKAMMEHVAGQSGKTMVEQGMKGDVSGMAGTGTGVALQMATPAVIDSIKSEGAAVPAPKSNVNLAKINELIGVKPAAIRVGTDVAITDMLASNPARGVLKAGLDEKALSKMNPLERYNAINSARNSAGAELDKVLQSSQKTVDITKTVNDTFNEILDPKLKKRAFQKFQQILAKNEIGNPLNKLTPMEARTIQRTLDDFAKFTAEGEAKTYADVAKKLRTGISQATIKVVPEAAPLDQQYGDLAGATKAAKKQVQQYATTAPQSQLRKLVKKAIIGKTGIPVP